jgi:signal transduction histidine kinase
LSNKDYLAEKGALKKSEEERTLGDFFYQARTISNLELQSEQQKNLLISFIYLTLLILLCDFIIRSITEPLKEATSVLMHISSGNYRVSIKHRSKNEIGRMIEALRSTSVRLGFDIANDKKQADELRRVKVGLDNLTKGIVIANSARKIIYINPAAIEIFARVEDELRKIIPDFSVNNIIGKNIEFFHRNPTYSINLINSLTHTVPLEMYIGDQIITANTTPIMNASRQRIGSVAEFENITERENNRLHLVNTIEKNQLLNQQVNQMQKVESLSRLTSGIAHDFNNILSAILGYNQLNKFAGEDCENQTLKEEILFNTEQVNMASERAVNLIKKMMAYSRQNTENKEIEVKPTYDLIDEVLSMVRPALTSIFQLNAEVDSTLTIQIDSTELHQILTNLIVNARDAMKQGGSIIISLRKVTTHELVCNSCAQTLEGGFIELSVADNGSGIETKVLEHIFDPFFTTKKVGEGTGLGLSTVCGMVHEAHGHIIVESKTTEPSRGTAFRLLFPQG